MGIPEAGKVYEGIYGVETNRVIREEREEEAMTAAATAADFSLDLIDLPTFNVASAMTLAKDIAVRITSSAAPSLGQMILFYDTTTTQIVDALYDENSVLSDDDIAAAGNNSNVFAYSAASTTRLAKEFRRKLRKHVALGVKRMQINIPTSQEEINRCLDPPPCPLPQTTDVDTVHRWLSDDAGLKPRQFITLQHITGRGGGGDIARVYKEAFYASELEGLIFLFAYRVMNVLRKLLKSSVSKSGRYPLLFVDGQPPAIKKMARLKRQKKREQAEMKRSRLAVDSSNETESVAAAMDMLHHSCERLMVRISQNVLPCVLLDIFRIPLAKTIGAKGLYLSQSSLSEAEDDIVRMVSCLLELETPVKHFSLSEQKGLVEYDCAGGGKNLINWSDVVSTVRRHTDVERRKVSVNLFSHDSDVLAKWNLMAAHHKQVRQLLVPAAATSGDDDEEEEEEAPPALASCRFFRSRYGLPPDSRLVYDLSESPVCLTPESTLLVMLTKGSDYNTPLVSGSAFDVQIRSEAAMFENLSCTCISGWSLFLETAAARDSASKDNCGNVSKDNVSGAPCGACGKYLVMPFWSTKFFFAAQASDFLNSLKHLYRPPVKLSSDTDKRDIHRALAINAASNVMAYLTMGSFNQRIFGNMSRRLLSDLAGDDEAASAGKSTLEITLESMAWNKKRTASPDIAAGASRPSKKKAAAASAPPVTKDLSLAVYNSRREFFNKHTEGGIPLFAGPMLRTHKRQLFGNLFPTAADESIRDLLDYETFFGKELEEDDAAVDWLANAEQAFAAPRNILVPAATPPPPPPPRESLEREFDKCLSRSRLKSTEHSLLTKMSNLLLTDSDHTGAAPFSIKCMNLLVIVYLNICGLEDERIVDQQTTPLIHQEYFSAGTKCATDRKNFMAAVLEFTLMQYKSEIGPGSTIRQAKRQNWQVVAQTLDDIEQRTSVCTNNCTRLQVSASPNKRSVWIPDQDHFMPVLGLAISKPWTPLALWSSFILSC